MRKYITDWIDLTCQIDADCCELPYGVSMRFSWACVGCWMWPEVFPSSFVSSLGMTTCRLVLLHRSVVRRYG
jgi:hypothetical protein